MKKLKASKIKYFDHLLRQLQVYEDYISINGYYKRLYFNVYTTVLNQLNHRQRRDFEFYIEERYQSIEHFNNSFEVIDKSIRSLPKEDFPFLFKHHDLGVDCYARKSTSGNELVYLASSDDPLFYFKLLNYLRLKTRNQFFIDTSDNKARAELCNLVATDAFVLKEPVIPYSNKVEDYCLCYVPLYSLIKEHRGQPYPAWRTFLSNFDQPEQDIFMAFVYSIFLFNNKGRQLLWLQGEGDTGKSTVVNVIANRLREFSPALVGALETADKKDSFDLEQLENARLAILSDTQESKVFNRADIFNITGNDIITINRKRKARVTKQLFCKVMITSNNPPQYNKLAAHQASRIILVAMNPNRVEQIKAERKRLQTQTSFYQQLYEEFYAFLAACEPFYYRYVQPDGSGSFQWR